MGRPLVTLFRIRVGLAGRFRRRGLRSTTYWHPPDIPVQRLWLGKRLVLATCLRRSLEWRSHNYEFFVPWTLLDARQNRIRFRFWIPVLNGHGLGEEMSRFEPPPGPFRGKELRRG